MFSRNSRIAIALCLSLAGTGAATAAGFNIVVNGQVVNTGDTPPAVINGHLLVPLAAIGNALGAYLEWRPSTRSVYGRQDMDEFLLPINSQTATVNGQAQTLEAPASIIAGHTMVPLRFVATALGANVRFEGATRTVYVQNAGTHTPNTGQTGGGTTPGTGSNGVPTTPATTAVNIDRFYVSPTRALRAGESYTVTLEGTAGLKAEFDYGQHRHIPMREEAPGRYVATVTVPTNAAFERDIVTGRLISGNTARDVQAGDRIVIDAEPPLIQTQTPKPGTRVETAQPYISAEFDDRGQTGVDPASVKLDVNGQDVTAQANVTSDNVVYRGTLNPGTVNVRLTVADRAGNIARSDWSFTVTGQETAAPPAAPTIDSPKSGDKVSGKMTVKGAAQPGTTVRVRTTYSGTVLFVLSQDGEVNTQEVEVGADGKWTTEPINLPSPSGLQNIKYTITATATNRSGLVSEPTQLTLSRR